MQREIKKETDIYVQLDDLFPKNYILRERKLTLSQRIT